MEEIMFNINDEMKTAADYAIKSAKEKFGQALDFSEQSIEKLDDLLEQIYQSFSNHAMDEETSNEISDTAIIWGGYLGEYMCMKWGGSWIRKGSDRLVSILNIEFSPINLVYQKISSHPEFTVENYLIESKKLIYSSVINPQQSQYMPENIGQPKKQRSIIESIKNVEIDKRLIYILAGIGGILLVIVASIIGYRNIKASNISAIGKVATNTVENTYIPLEKTLVTATPYSPSTRYPTITTLPTYTPKPTFTPQPSRTPYLTYTQTATLTPTEMETLIISKPTIAPRMSPTPVPDIYTSTPVPPTNPPPTVPPPPPVIIESCEIDPSIVPIGSNVTITFIVHFSSPGYGFDAAVNPQYPGQSGCSGSDSDGDGMAYCDGSSGELPESTTIYVTLSSSVGNCDVSYSSR
jgi:hypothetical protein